MRVLQQRTGACHRMATACSSPQPLSLQDALPWIAAGLSSQQALVTLRSEHRARALSWALAACRVQQRPAGRAGTGRHARHRQDFTGLPGPQVRRVARARRPGWP